MQISDPPIPPVGHELTLSQQQMFWLRAPRCRLVLSLNSKRFPDEKQIGLKNKKKLTKSAQLDLITVFQDDKRKCV